MVLDEASPTSFADTEPTTSADTDLDSGDAWSSLRRTNDPGNIRHTTTLPSFINLRNFPRPAPLPFAQLRGWNDERVVRITCANAASLSSLAQRQLTRPEWESLTFHVARMNAISSYGFPVGLSLAWSRCYATRESFRFPFHKPKIMGVHPEGRFNPNAFMDVLKGSTARLQWHFIRAVVYGTFGGFLGAAFFTSFATMSSAIHQAKDERMGELTEMVKQEAMRQREKFNQRRRGNAPLRKSDKERDSEEDGENREPDLQELAVGANERREIEARDAPKSVEYGAGGGGVYSDASFDDASPTASSSPSPQQPAAEQNAWHRIRQERSRGQPQARQAPMSPQPRQQSQQNAWMERRRESAAQTPAGGTKEESFSFSSSEEERQLAKEEAQKEFDARVERERQGRDFVDDDASPSASRWR